MKMKPFDSNQSDPSRNGCDMKTFTLNAVVTTLAQTHVEAATLDEAIKIARDRAVKLDAKGFNTFTHWIVEEVTDGEVKVIWGATA